MSIGSIHTFAGFSSRSPLVIYEAEPISAIFLSHAVTNLEQTGVMGSLNLYLSPIYYTRICSSLLIIIMNNDELTKRGNLESCVVGKSLPRIFGRELYGPPKTSILYIQISMVVFYCRSTKVKLASFLLINWCKNRRKQFIYIYISCS